MRRSSMWLVGMGCSGRWCMAGSAVMRLRVWQGWWTGARSLTRVRIRHRLRLRFGSWRCGGLIGVGVLGGRRVVCNLTGGACVGGGGVLLAAAYALEWSSWLHSTVGLAVAWGVFPVLVGYWAQTKSLSLAFAVVAAAAMALSMAQQALSTPARHLRRRVTGAPPLRSVIRVGIVPCCRPPGSVRYNCWPLRMSCSPSDGSSPISQCRGPHAHVWL